MKKQLLKVLDWLTSLLRVTAVEKKQPEPLPGFDGLSVEEFRNTSRLYIFNKSRWEDAEPKTVPSKKVKS